MKNKIIYSLIILINLLNSCLTLRFFIDVKSKELKCIGEYIMENTLALFSASTPTSEIVSRLIDPNGITVYKKDNQYTTKIAYTAKESGNYQFCLSNNSNQLQRVQFEVLVGVAAKDYSSIAKQSNLKPMEINVNELINFIYIDKKARRWFELSFEGVK